MIWLKKDPRLRQQFETLSETVNWRAGLVGN